MSTKIPLSCTPDKGKTITFHRFPHHIWHDYNYSLHERVILCRVWSFQNSTPPLRCYLSYDQWAKELALHRVTAINLLNKMVGKGLLKKNRAPEGSNEWSLVVSDYQYLSNPELASSVGLPSLVVSDYPPSSVGLPALVAVDYPRRSLEDHKEDQLEDQVVADAPLPTESLLKNPLIDLDSVKEPLEIHEAPPIPAAPPKAQKVVTWDDVRSMVTDEEWAAIETWIDYRANVHKKKKPTTPLAVKKSIKGHGKFLCRAIQYSMEKKWEGIELPDSIKNASISKTGLTKEQIDTLWDLGWKHYHPKDWPEQKAPPPWVDEWHRELYRRACCEAFGANYQSFIEGEPAKKSNFNIGKFRRAIETIDLPETSE